jgi:catechol 2,3-dioxygenase-like lactoylglutathione lyase family enzyme
MGGPIIRRKDALGVHSLDRFAFTVPDIALAEGFYRTFGLCALRDGTRLDLATDASPHRWGTLVANGRPKKLSYLSFAAYDDDFDRLAARFAVRGRADAHPLADSRGAWTRDADGTLVQLVAGPKVSPAAPTPAPAAAPRLGKAAAPSRSGAPRVRACYLSHVLLFTPDVQAQVDFYTQTLGLRLSDRSGDLIAFLHAPHGSEHHVLAFAKSERPGLHHSSWVVPSIDDIGLGAERMRDAGYSKGWGLGRHVIGSNYFHYVQDPWGSFAEYSFGLDYVPAEVDWVPGDHAPQDSFYVWGPPVPDDFVVNHEGP